MGNHRFVFLGTIVGIPIIENEIPQIRSRKMNPDIISYGKKNNCQPGDFGSSFSDRIIYEVLVWINSHAGIRG